MLTADGGKVRLVAFPTFQKPLWAAPATSAPMPAPTFEVARAADGAINVSVAADPGATLHLDLRTDAVVRGGTAQGMPAPMLAEPGKWTHFIWRASKGLTIRFQPIGHGTLDIRYAAFTPAWPAGAKPLAAMPANLMAWDMAGSSVAAGALRSTW